MPFDAKQFFNDQKLSIAQPDAKHYRSGWANIPCPFCSGSSGFHLGFNLSRHYFSCYRCGWHPIEKVIEAITGFPKNKIRSVVQKYTTLSSQISPLSESEIIRPSSLQMPFGASPMTERHKQYLANRNFDPDRLEKEFGLLGTGHLGKYRFRIIAPIYFQSELVSYQGRDITGNQRAKYKACAKENEVIPHKHILYGIDDCWHKKVIVVEGVTGVWRIGKGTVGTFGSEYMASQLRLLTKRFDQFFLLFDPDKAGQIAADKLSIDLMAMGKSVEIWDVPEGIDSGSLSQDYADQLAKEIY